MAVCEIWRNSSLSALNLTIASECSPMQDINVRPWLVMDWENTIVAFVKSYSIGDHLHISNEVV